MVLNLSKCERTQELSCEVFNITRNTTVGTSSNCGKSDLVAETSRTFEVSTLAMLTFAGGPVGSGGGAGAAGGAGDAGCCSAPAPPPAGLPIGMNALAGPPPPSPAKAGGLVGAALGTNAVGAADCVAIERVTRGRDL